MNLFRRLFVQKLSRNDMTSTHISLVAVESVPIARCADHHHMTGCHVLSFP